MGLEMQLGPGGVATVPRSERPVYVGGAGCIRCAVGVCVSSWGGWRDAGWMRGGPSVQAVDQAEGQHGLKRGWEAEAQ